MGDSTYYRDIARIVEVCGTLNPNGQRFKSFDTYCEEVLKPETIEALQWSSSFHNMTVHSYAGRVTFEKGTLRSDNPFNHHNRNKD